MIVGKAVVLRCGCAHSFQDGKYGLGMRVHNVCKDGTQTAARCTVCGTKHSIRALKDD